MRNCAISWKDARQYATALTNVLQLRGFKCFFDSAQYAAGDNWRNAGKRALEKSRRMIVIASPASAQSKALELETKDFCKTGRPVIPIVFGREAISRLEDMFHGAISSDTLCITEDASQLAVGPSAAAIQKINHSFQNESSVRRRVRALKFLAAILFILMLTASGMAWLAIRNGKMALIARVEADKAAYRANISRDAALHALKLNLSVYTRATHVCGRIAAAVTDRDRSFQSRKQEATREMANLSNNQEPVVFTEAIRDRIGTLGRDVENWTQDDAAYEDKLRRDLLAIASQYRSDWEAQTKEVSEDARKLMLALIARPIYEKAIELATRVSNGTWDAEARKGFEQLYWGELVLFEPGNVASAMVSLRRELNGGSTNSTTLRMLARDLEAASKEELASLPRTPSM